MKYEVRYNKTIITTETIEEAESQAKCLLDPCAPFPARIVAVNDDGAFVRTVKTLQPNSICSL